MTNAPSINPRIRRRLDDLYARCNTRDLVSPDPLAFVLTQPELRDREIVGLIASSLAYGRVGQIMKSVSAVLDRLVEPYAFVHNTGKRAMMNEFHGFKHRFTTGEDMVALLLAVKKVIKRHGSLHACFASRVRQEHNTVLPALELFVNDLAKAAGRPLKFLIPQPGAGSACKRLLLFLRWMVRQDKVDPGGWHSVCPSLLIVPMDTHMHKIAGALGLTQRKQATMRTAVEVTNGFRTIAPADPTRYDFVLTRLGIRSDMEITTFLKSCGVKHGM